jgi:5-oxopent-3-ene-1,2,5-tricarboxylate decarboxylase/2-hydroxyhepta-2,4-diene-1,7-dioate isomerase
LRTHVNGAVVQDGSTDEMTSDMHYLVADIARTTTLAPGDVLLSGTPANSRPVQPGDVVEVEVGGLGRL